MKDALMMTGAFSWNVSKLLSKLKLVTDNFLFIYAEANWEVTEKNTACAKWYYAEDNSKKNKLRTIMHIPSYVKNEPASLLPHSHK